MFILSGLFFAKKTATLKMQPLLDYIRLSTSTHINNTNNSFLIKQSLQMQNPN